MPKNVNTFTQFLPLPGAGNQKVIVKNQSYFSMIFLGGNYLSRGSILQRIFGGRDEVSLIAGLRLLPDGLLITAVEEPNIVLDKRTIKPGKITNVPLVLNLLVKIPAYMDSIGFSFKIATTERSDNFSGALDVLNDSTNKSVIDSFLPGVVGKALGVGKIVKDIFDKIDSANDKNLIQLVVNDFIVPSDKDATGANILQEGYLVIFVKNEEEEPDEDQGSDQIQDTKNLAEKESAVLSDGFGNDKELAPTDLIHVDVAAMEQLSLANNTNEAVTNEITNLEYDEVRKVLKADGKVVSNTYLVFKVQQDLQRGENLNANWSKKFVLAVETLSNEFTKTKAKLEELQPRVNQYISEATALLADDSSFTPSEKSLFKEKYRTLIAQEASKFI
jgi:hypothetical protein